MNPFGVKWAGNMVLMVTNNIDGNLYINMGKTKMNHPFGNGNHSVPPIYGDSGDSLLLFYPHYDL